jgi:hypothetical protein
MRQIVARYLFWEQKLARKQERLFFSHSAISRSLAPD